MVDLCTFWSRDFVCVCVCLFVCLFVVIVVVAAVAAAVNNWLVCRGCWRKLVVIMC